MSINLSKYRTGAPSFKSEKVADATEEHGDDGQHTPDQQQLRLFTDLEVVSWV